MLPRSTKHFRLFVTNARGRIDTVAEEIHAASDEEAIAKAVVKSGGKGFEL